MNCAYYCISCLFLPDAMNACASAKSGNVARADVFPPILLLTNWKRKYVHWGIEQIKKKKKLNRPWGSVLHRARKLSWNKFEALDIFRFIWSHVIPTAHMYTILLIIFHHQKLFSITGILNLFFIYIILLWIKSEVLLKHGCLYILSISGFSNVAND